MKKRSFNQGKKTWAKLEEIHRFGYSYASIFADFLDTCLYALLSLTENIGAADILDRLKHNKLSGRYEDAYLQIVGRYKENVSRSRGERPADYFAQAWWLLQQETREYGHDVLGEIYEAQISFGEHGQFFTPANVADMMCQMVGVDGAGETVCDPCVGSGRFFISMAKARNDLHFTGVDLSPVCAKMTALNMWLFNLEADIYHGNSLTMRMFHVWQIRKGGFLFESEVSSLPEPVRTQMKAQAQQALFNLADVKKGA